MSQEMFSSSAGSLTAGTGEAIEKRTTSASGDLTGYSGMGSETSVRGLTLKEVAKGYVQRNPGRAMLLSAGAAFVISLLLPGKPTTKPD